MAYSYELEYRKSSDHFNGDVMSRLPLAAPSNTAQESSIFYFSHVEDLPISAQDIKVGTSGDPVLSKVWSYTMNGWPNYMTEDSLKLYFVRRQELSADQGCVLWGLRVVVPQRHRQQILKDLHHEHPGICKMKALAHSYVWWPGMDFTPVAPQEPDPGSTSGERVSDTSEMGTATSTPPSSNSTAAVLPEVKQRRNPEANPKCSKETGFARVLK